MDKSGLKSPKSDRWDGRRPQRRDDRSGILPSMAKSSPQIIAQLRQAAALFEGGRSRQAREVATEVLKKEPRNVHALRIFALSAVNSLQWPEAMKAAEKALKKEAKRKARIEQRRAKRSSSSQKIEKENEMHDIDKPITLDDLTNPDKK